MNGGERGVSRGSQADFEERDLKGELSLDVGQFFEGDGPATTQLTLDQRLGLSALHGGQGIVEDAHVDVYGEATIFGLLVIIRL